MTKKLSALVQVEMQRAHRRAKKAGRVLRASAPRFREIDKQVDRLEADGKGDSKRAEDLKREGAHHMQAIRLARKHVEHARQVRELADDELQGEDATA